MPLISAIRLSTEVLGKEHAFSLRTEVTVEIVWGLEENASVFKLIDMPKRNRSFQLPFTL